MFIIQKEFEEKLDKTGKAAFEKLKKDYKRLNLHLLIGKKMIGLDKLQMPDVSFSASVYAIDARIKVFEFLHKQAPLVVEQLGNFIKEYEITE